MERLVEENRDRRIFRISGTTAEPDQGPEGASGTSQTEPEPTAPPEDGGAARTS
ncbi:hypothetical protein ACFV1L_31330 [Kitasatospora sp. NPDC059646]|uniref:hypothetical protein n=1 Tax=Kitasatospora sp. NPDC059646 TaxID=3346893 RepID=UPI0036986B1B